MCNPLVTLAFVAFTSSAISSAMTIKPLPKICVDDLSPQTFDAVYLDKAPVILVSGDTSATARPSNLHLSTIERSCSGWVKGNYVKTKATKGEGEWAGLKDGPNEKKVDFLQFVESMGKQLPDKPPRYMFDVSMTNLCPSLLADIHIPPQFVGIFESQFLWRHFEDDNPHKCAEMPFMNMYLTEAGFETDLHIDSANTAFLASMCEGWKKWRVISPHDFAQFHSELAMPNTGRFIEGKWVNAEIKRPFETWADSSPLNSLDAVVFEGVLEPGEILYIPPGAPHAAITLDHSIMIASNDQSIQSLVEFDQYCSEDRSWFGCEHYQTRLATVQDNYMKYANILKRDEAMTFAKAFDCETAVEMLARPRLEVTPMNFYKEAQKGPMIVMQYDRSCLRCLQILDQLIENRMVREELPEFVYVAPRDRSSKIRGTFAGSSSVVVSRYYGPIDLEFLKVWINMKASQTHFDVSPWWWDAIVRGIHTCSGTVVSSLSIVGLSPSSDDVSLICVMFVVITVLTTTLGVGIYFEGAKTSGLGKEKKKV